MSKESLIGNWRADVLARRIAPHIRGSEVLDIGAGSCRVARQLMRVSDVQVTPIDAVDYNATDLALTLYGGRDKKLPYGDKSFDTSLLVFVLHHASFRSHTVREALRVSRERVIVVEDTPGNRFERAAWQRWDYYLNHRNHPGIPITHEPFTQETWEDTLRRKDAAIIHEEAFRHPLLTAGLYPHTLFVLEPNPSTSPDIDI